MYRIGIDLGGTIIKLGLLKKGRVIGFEAIEASSKNGLINSLPRVETAINKMLAREKVSRGQLSGVGIAFPGIIDPIRNKVISTNQKYDDADTLDLAAWVESHWQVPFCLDNDARLSLIGEWQYGAAKGHQNVVMVTIGTGIGTGVVIEGKVLYGGHFQAGSLGGHFTIDYKGRRCSCGNIGCIEAMASSAFLSAIITDHPALSIAFKEEAAHYDFKKIFILANNGHPEALIVRNECMDIWAAGLVNYIHAYDPTLIVMAGGIMNSADTILPYLREKVHSLAWCPAHTVDIVNSIHGDHAALLGIEYRLIRLAETLALP